MACWEVVSRVRSIGEVGRMVWVGSCLEGFGVVDILGGIFGRVLGGLVWVGVGLWVFYYVVVVVLIYRIVVMYI